MIQGGPIKFPFDIVVKLAEPGYGMDGATLDQYPASIDNLLASNLVTINESTPMFVGRDDNRPLLLGHGKKLAIRSTLWHNRPNEQNNMPFRCKKIAERFFRKALIEQNGWWVLWITHPN